MTSDEIAACLINLGDKERADHSLRFFKTAEGEYGEGDRFLGIRVPVLREKVRQFREADLSAAEELLRSPWHEVRLFAVFLLVDKFRRKKPDLKAEIMKVFTANLDRINNWDLVDSSAPCLTGPWFWENDRSLLGTWVKSDSLWLRRIAVMSTFYFIKQNHYEETLAFCEELLDDREDLIHKATGWMLREIGNRDKKTETDFLEKFHTRMPRTMLRYGIEKFPAEERKSWLAGEIPPSAGTSA